MTKCFFYVKTIESENTLKMYKKNNNLFNYISANICICIYFLTFLAHSSSADDFLLLSVSQYFLSLLSDGL